MRKLFKKRTYNFNFLSMRKIAFGFAITLLIASVVSFATRGLNYGVDFEGGVLLEISSEKPINMDKMRADLGFLKEVSLQSIGSGQEIQSVLIQTQSEEDGLTGPALVEKIKSVLGDGYTYDRVETIGPRIGQELKEKSLLASVLALLAISIYIWLRFEWPFAIGCMISLAYTLIIVVGCFSVFGWEFDMIVVAGLLSLAGYACNDTIVTYDRVRENLNKFRHMGKDELLNKSINETLSRTILTGVTTLFVLLVLLLIGGQTLKGFSISMTLGLIIGTGSSIFLAVPMLRYFDIYQVANKNDVSPFGNKS